MKYYLNMLSLGDNLISLAFLEQLNTKVNILGTKHTENIINLLGLEHKVEIYVVFNDIPTFYDIRKYGIFKASLDFLKFIRYLQIHNIKEVIFEKKDFRSSLTSMFTNTNIYYPNSINTKVYENRKELIENIYKQSIDFNSYLLQIQNPKTIVINPLTRVELKNIKKNHLNLIIDELMQHNYEIYLIDIENRYQEFEKKVHSYLTNTTLNDVKKLIKKCDLYIGGDSFLIHLAYYLQRNYFMIFYRDNDDFLPPNITENFYIKAHNNRNFDKELREKFQNIGLIQ